MRLVIARRTIIVKILGHLHDIDIFWIVRSNNDNIRFPFRPVLVRHRIQLIIFPRAEQVRFVVDQCFRFRCRCYAAGDGEIHSKED
ncbi:hypothetical protein D3C77_613030 [compost metagenome]